MMSIVSGVATYLGDIRRAEMKRFVRALTSHNYSHALEGQCILPRNLGSMARWYEHSTPAAPAVLGRKEDVLVRSCLGLKPYMNPKRLSADTSYGPIERFQGHIIWEHTPDAQSTRK